MTAGTGGPPDGGEIEALVTDRYLESLLVGRSDPGLMAVGPPPRVEPGIHLAAARLLRDLPRFHPSFRFEERLALRLAEVAEAMRQPAAGEPGTLIHLAPAAAGEARPVDLLDAGPLDSDGLRGGLLDGPPEQRLDWVRPYLIGGALTSAALSLAGAAFVAWRRTRPPGTPMARAVRAVARGRLA